MLQQKALGRGLASLIPTSGENKQGGSHYFLCSIEQVIPNREQPRKVFIEENLKELADSIQENGIIQPLIVRKVEGDRYELIAGERRLRAAKLVGLTQVPIVVIETSQDRNLELALIENIQRQDLNPIEEAIAYKQLIEKYSYTQEECAKKVGKDRSSVANAIRLLNLSDEIQDYIVQGRLSMGHARAILGIEDRELQSRLALLSIEDKVSVREIENWIRDHRNKVEVKSVIIEKKEDPQINFIQNEMTKVLGTKVKIKPQGKRGKVVIDYYSPEDLDRIFNAIMG